MAADYPLLIASLPAADRGSVVFNNENMLLTETRLAQVSQWSLSNQQLQKRDDWTITALEVTPLVRRVIVDREESVRRVGLTLNLSHARVGDLRIKLIAPSGRTVEIDPKVDRASAFDDIHIDPNQLRDLIGESVTGTWSLSIRDEELGVAGQLVGWNLQLNSQGLVEDFQRGLNISDPVEREAGNIWFSDDGRFAIARAMQSDSARIWDLAYAKPIRAVAVNELEQFIGLSAGAKQLVTATQDTVNLWDTSTGDRVATLEVGAASSTATLTADGTEILVQRRSDQETKFELWSLLDPTISTTISVAGTPALVSSDATGSRIAVADYDRAVRIWDMRSGDLIAHIDLAAQPSVIQLAAGGEVLGIVFAEEGAAMWRIGTAVQQILADSGFGQWQLAFSPSGNKALVGRPEHGFQIYATADGRRIGPGFGSGGGIGANKVFGFSPDELSAVTGGPVSTARLWRVPTAAAVNYNESSAAASIWPAAGDAIAAATPDASKIVIGDRYGNVNILPADGGPESFLATEEIVSFLGHSGRIRLLSVSSNGERIVSVATDNSIRVWDTATGLPQSFFGEVAGSPVERVVFSPDASRLGVLSGNRVQIMDTDTGSTVALFDLAEQHHSMTFTDNDHLFLGSESGTLRVVNRESADTWNLQPLWQGSSAIRWLEASPRARFLVFVDQNNLAQQFILDEGRLGELSVQLPGRVEEVAFSPSGSRILFRTATWIHRASSAASGLIWIDAVLTPRPVNGSRMIFAATNDQTPNPLANRVFVAISSDGYVQLKELIFDASGGGALFGNKQELLAEWRLRLGLN